MFTQIQENTIILPDVLEIDMNNWSSAKPKGISACIRIYNDAEFVIPSTLSILPYVNEVVFIYQPSSDYTLKKLKWLANRYPDKVKIEYYPENVFWIDTDEFKSLPTTSIFHPVYMSNWGLSKCKYNWILKIESDVILSPNFGELRNNVLLGNQAQMKYVGFYIINLAGREFDKFSVTHPRNHGTDEAIFNNDPYWNFIRLEKWEMVNFLERGNWSCYGWGGYHLKRCKERYITKPLNETLATLSEETVREAMRHYHLTVNPYMGIDDSSGIPELWNIDTSNWR